MESSNEITTFVLEEVSKRFTEVRIWRNNRVEAKAVRRGGRIGRVSAGINGQADISGIVGPSGIRLEIEVKAGRDVQSLNQQAFQKMIEDRGGWYLIARGGAECVAELQERIRQHDRQHDRQHEGGGHSGSMQTDI